MATRTANKNTTNQKKGISKMNITPMLNKEPRHLCLSVDKRNQRYLDLIDDYSLEFNMNKAQTVFRIINEYNTYRCLDSVRA